MRCMRYSSTAYFQQQQEHRLLQNLRPRRPLAQVSIAVQQQRPSSICSSRSSCKNVSAPEAAALAIDAVLRWWEGCCCLCCCCSYDLPLLMRDEEEAVVPVHLRDPHVRHGSSKLECISFLIFVSGFVAMYGPISLVRPRRPVSV